MVNGRRIEPGARVLILDGPYRGRFGIFRRKRRNMPGKVFVTPFGLSTYLTMSGDAIRRVEATQNRTKADKT